MPDGGAGAGVGAAVVLFAVVLVLAVTFLAGVVLLGAAVMLPPLLPLEGNTEAAAHRHIQGIEVV